MDRYERIEGGWAFIVRGRTLTVTDHTLPLDESAARIVFSMLVQATVGR